MKYFLYDRDNRRLVLVDDIFPSINRTTGKWTNSLSLTPSSKMGYLYNTKYVWENVKLEVGSTGGYVVHYIKESEGAGLILTPLLHLPQESVCIIYGGQYVYNEPKS